MMRRVTSMAAPSSSKAFTGRTVRSVITSLLYRVYIPGKKRVVLFRHVVFRTITAANFYFGSRGLVHGFRICHVFSLHLERINREEASLGAAGSTQPYSAVIRQAEPASASQVRLA